MSNFILPIKRQYDKINFNLSIEENIIKNYSVYNHYSVSIG